LLIHQSLRFLNNSPQNFHGKRQCEQNDKSFTFIAFYPESFELYALPAGLLTYALFESLPALYVAVTIKNFKKLTAITAAGTVAEFPLIRRGTAFPIML
jgi:hypothetical protein